MKSMEQRSLNVASAAAAKALALEQTKDLEEERESLEMLLLDALTSDPRPDWEKKKDQSKYPVPKPAKVPALSLPLAPDRTSALFNPPLLEPQLGFLDKLIPGRRKEKLRLTAESNKRVELFTRIALEEAIASWEARTHEVETANTAATSDHKKRLAEWDLGFYAFNSDKQNQHQSIDDLKARYLCRDTEAVIDYLEEVLNKSEYPDSFPKEHAFEYQPSTKTLVLDYELPNQSALPSIKEVKYVASRSEFQKVLIADTWLKKTYDEVLYQISLRTLFELFKSDEADALVSVVFNGWVRSIDKGTGSEVHACVMSLEARKDEFLAINLSQVDCKACFKKLKGVAASKLIELSPVKPLVSLNREDRRFVDGYAVVDGIDERTNLAAMDWLDFENLIREVFEKEFSKGGGEVKITQASRDGGVDAIAFDPDPIRGGKIVIQAKRYTNTVGVSAVRDLYGTVHNEGANKGILVTTSDYGPDAYAFAKDKPLTLISGGELLYLLEQHGHTAKIDLAEAKRTAAENAR